MICHILRRDCLLKYVNEGKIKRRKEVGEIPESRRKQLLDVLEGKRGYCKLREEALDGTVWSNELMSEC